MPIVPQTVSRRKDFSQIVEESPLTNLPSHGSLRTKHNTQRAVMNGKCGMGSRSRRLQIADAVSADPRDDSSDLAARECPSGRTRRYRLSQPLVRHAIM